LDVVGDQSFLIEDLRILGVTLVVIDKHRLAQF
jgi:hypothetical protein